MRVRAKLMGTAQKPRLAVFRSNQGLYAQLIDDEQHATLLGLSTKGLKLTGSKQEQAIALGKALAEEATKKKITAAVFDRGPYRFHGRVKAVADAARSGGLAF